MLNEIRNFFSNQNTKPQEQPKHEETKKTGLKSYFERSITIVNKLIDEELKTKRGWQGAFGKTKAYIKRFLNKLENLSDIGNQIMKLTEGDQMSTELQAQFIKFVNSIYDNRQINIASIQIVSTNSDIQNTLNEDENEEIQQIWKEIRDKIKWYNHVVELYKMYYKLYILSKLEKSGNQLNSQEEWNNFFDTISSEIGGLSDKLPKAIERAKATPPVISNSIRLRPSLAGSLVYTYFGLSQHDIAATGTGLSITLILLRQLLDAQDDYINQVIEKFSAIISTAATAKALMETAKAFNSAKKIPS